MLGMAGQSRSRLSAVTLPPMEWPLLAAVPEDQPARGAGHRAAPHLRDGEVVFHQNDPADTLHLIRSGRVAVRIDAGRGDSVIAAVLGPGEMFGELALLDEEAMRSATIVALEPWRRCRSTSWTSAACGESPAAAEVLIALLAAQVRRLSQQLGEALYVPADKRVLRRVVDMATRLRGRPRTGRRDLVPLTQDHLADLAGTSRITVNRTLRAEQERGTLELARGRTVIRDLEAIEARAFGRRRSAARAERPNTPPPRRARAPSTVPASTRPSAPARSRVAPATSTSCPASLVSGLQPRGQVGGVAHRGVLQPPVRAHAARHHRPAGQPDAHAHALAGHALAASQALKRSSRGPIISRAAASAWAAWSSSAIGAPNTAMIPSPM